MMSDQINISNIVYGWLAAELAITINWLLLSNFLFEVFDSFLFSTEAFPRISKKSISKNSNGIG